MRNKINLVVLLLALGFALRYPWPKDLLDVLDLVALLTFTAAVTVVVIDVVDRRRGPHAKADENKD